MSDRAEPAAREPARARRRHTGGRVHVDPPGRDYVRLASEEEVDLILLDGRRPLLGEGVPRRRRRAGPRSRRRATSPCSSSAKDRSGDRRRSSPVLRAVRRRRPRLGRARARGVDRDVCAVRRCKLIGAADGEREGRREPPCSQRVARRAASSPRSRPSLCWSTSRTESIVSRDADGAGLLVDRSFRALADEGLGPRALRDRRRRRRRPSSSSVAGCAPAR